MSNNHLDHWDQKGWESQNHQFQIPHMPRKPWVWHGQDRTWGLQCPHCTHQYVP